MRLADTIAKRLLVLLTSGLMAGCVTDRRAQVPPMDVSFNGASLLVATNAAPGQFYEVGVYVIMKGDSFGRIANRFRVSVHELRTLNPGIDPTRLRVGQKVRVYERGKE